MNARPAGQQRLVFLARQAAGRPIAAIRSRFGFQQDAVPVGKALASPFRAVSSRCMIYRTSRVVTTRLTTSKIICRYRGRAGAQAAVEAARSASAGRRVEDGVGVAMRAVDCRNNCRAECRVLRSAQRNALLDSECRQPLPRMIVTVPRSSSVRHSMPCLFQTGIMIGHRAAISRGDEDALFPVEKLLPSPRVLRCGVRAARLGSWHVNSSSDWGTPNARYRERPGERQPGPQELSARSPTIFGLRWRLLGWVAM